MFFAKEIVSWLRMQKTQAKRPFTAENYSKARLILVLFAFLNAALIAVFLIAEKLGKEKRFVYEHEIFFPAGDFLDMIIMAPIFAIVFWIVHNIIFNDKNSTNYLLRWTSVAAISVFIYGMAMHMTGNAIHTIFTERRPYTIPKAHLSLIYFFDETLSHLLLLSGWYTALYAWTLADNLVFIPSTLLSVFSVVTSALMGLTHSISFIEGDSPLLGVGVLAPLLILVIFIKNYNAKSVWRSIHSHPISLHGFYLSITVIVGEMLYYWWQGSFVQPSEKGGMMCLFFGKC
jgi:hypothetical protein